METPREEDVPMTSRFGLACLPDNHDFEMTTSEAESEDDEMQFRTKFRTIWTSDKCYDYSVPKLELYGWRGSRITRRRIEALNQSLRYEYMASIKIPRVLIVGSTGLLGRALIDELREKFIVVTHSNTRKPKKYTENYQIDLSEELAIDKLLFKSRPSYVIYCAAERRPNICFENPEKATKINLTVPTEMVKKCHEFSIKFIYISTDYVFDGTSPPYTPADTPNPQGPYQIQKYEAEKNISKYDEMIILRVPLLYGAIETLDESSVTLLYQQMKSEKIPLFDDLQIRYPTFTKDVASIIEKMLSFDHFKEKISGIYHFQNDYLKGLTKYDMALIIANLANIDTSKIEASRALPKYPVPMNSCLDISKLYDIIPIDEIQHTKFEDGIKEALRPYL